MITVTLLLLYSDEDSLEVYDGQNVNHPRIGSKMCGYNIPTTLVSSANDLFIRFQSRMSSKSSFKLLVEGTQL